MLQSFEIVRLDDNGDYPSHGYCGLRHGDVAFFRDRHWKWQQIGSGAFREVPIEEWEDGRFPLGTGFEYERHEKVDQDGKRKWYQRSEGVWLVVPLEEWDEGVHGLEGMGLSFVARMVVTRRTPCTSFDGAFRICSLSRSWLRSAYLVREWTSSPDGSDGQRALCNAQRRIAQLMSTVQNPVFKVMGTFLLNCRY